LGEKDFEQLWELARNTLHKSFLTDTSFLYGPSEIALAALRISARQQQDNMRNIVDGLVGDEIVFSRG